MGRHHRATQREPRYAADLLRELEKRARPLRHEDHLDSLLFRIGKARYVLLGEASHGTSEYYAWRAAISRRLIREQEFSFIAVEGDWPDCYRLNRYVKGAMDYGASAEEVLQTFHRWPAWMWANQEIVDFAEWLREHNAGLPEERKVGFYGLDVYSLWDSLFAVLGYLQKNHPSSLAAARRAFRCFEPYGEDVQDYAAANRWVDVSCEDEVVALLAEIRRELPRADGDGEAQFNAEQNALTVKNAEHYYRTMVRGGPSSWNVRDRHMLETLDRLMAQHGPQAKAIVWEHNTHVGDARFTDMADDGMVNVGQLVREGHAADGVVLVGFSSYKGSVIAGREWEAPWEQMQVPPGRFGSWEDLLHWVNPADKLLVFGPEHRTGPLAEPRGHRAIGVVYHPHREHGNYVPTVLPSRYDALLFLDQTTALHPLSGVTIDEQGEVPETYPTGV